jgi:hypothetical protein
VEVPNEEERLPNESLIVPMDTIELPNEDARFSNDTSSGPNETIEFSNEAKRLPNDTSSEPIETIEVPNEPKRLSNDTSSEPIETVEVPNEAERLPNETSSVPNETVELPNEAERLPNNTFSIPNETIELPNEAATIPDDINGELNQPIIEQGCVPEKNINSQTEKLVSKDLLLPNDEDFMHIKNNEMDDDETEDRTIQKFNCKITEDHKVCNLKEYNNAKYCAKNGRYFGVRCQECDILFVDKKEKGDTSNSIKPSLKTPMYMCGNHEIYASNILIYCTWSLCHACYIKNLG